MKFSHERRLNDLIEVGWREKEKIVAGMKLNAIQIEWELTKAEWIDLAAAILIFN